MGSNGAMACVEIVDDQIGAKNTEPDGPTPRVKGLLVRGCEFPSRLDSQEPPLLPLCGRSLMLYIIPFGLSSSYTC